MKAIIIGAGIGGLTAGIALSQAGLEVEIYEREPELRAVGTGLTLWANAIHALDKIGVGDAVRQLGMMEYAESGGFHTLSGHDLLVMDQAKFKQVVDLPNIVVHRADLQAVLVEHFQGTIHYAKQLASYQQNSERICATFEDGHRAEGDLLIGCDGIHSVVRQQMIPESKSIYAGYTAYRGVVEFDHTRVGHMWGESWGYGNRFGITPLSNNRVYWFATANTHEGNITPVGMRQTTLFDMFAGWHDPIIDLLRETPEQAIFQHDIYEIAPLHNWIDGRAILLGDSAHAMTPNLGQGACQAIEDAIVLGQVFNQSQGIATALANYQAMRLERANHILKQSQMIGRVGQLENRIICALRNTALRWMPSGVQMQNIVNIIGHQV